MDTSSLYLIGEQGLLKVGTWFPLVAVSVIVGTILGLVVATIFGLNGVAMSVVITLVIAPFIGELRARRLAALANMSYDELSSKSGVKTIPGPRSGS
jgi:hypothetical protein